MNELRYQPLGRKIVKEFARLAVETSFIDRNRAAGVNWWKQEGKGRREKISAG